MYSEYKQDDLPMGYPIELEQSRRYTNFKIKSDLNGDTYLGLQFSPTLESKPKVLEIEVTTKSKSKNKTLF